MHFGIVVHVDAHALGPVAEADNLSPFQNHVDVYEGVVHFQGRFGLVLALCGGYGTPDIVLLDDVLTLGEGVQVVLTDEFQHLAEGSVQIDVFFEAFE